ncbi:MAG: ArsA-related P-loop ATPase [Bdellovibrionales bacterium]
MRSLFENNKVVVCTGSGGVGKTTISASLGVLAAQYGQRVLVLTIDPAKRLATALGIQGDANIVKVPGQNFKGELYAGRIDSVEIFNAFIREAAPSNDVVEKILKNKLYEQLSTTLSGSQEFTSLVKLYEEQKSNKYDLIILDTPPTQHAIDFLHSPEKIYALFQSSITKWFINNTQKGGSVWSRILHKGTQTVLSIFHRVTGSDFMDELSDFFFSLKDLQENITQTCQGTQELLKDKNTAFLLVTSFDRAKIQEASSYYGELVSGGYQLDSIIINRAFPKWVLEPKPEIFSSESLEAEYDRQNQYYTTREEMFDQFQKDFADRVNVVKLHELEEELSGLEGLKLVADLIETQVNNETTGGMK